MVQRQVTRVSRKPAVWQYQWDAADRLTAVTTPDHTSWRYRYDPFGRRIAKQRLGPGDEVVEQTDFTWDGPRLAEQSSAMVAGPGGQVVAGGYRPGRVTPLTQAEHTSPCDLAEAPQEQIDRRFYAIVTDLIGTPAELTAPDGTVAGHQQHTLWGSTQWQGGAGTPLRFPGQYEDPETGLHYNQHRYYDPVAGAYLTPDPLGLAAAPNPHAYVLNPQVLTDPLGLAPYDASAGPNGGLGNIVSVNAKDPAADLLAQRIGGQPSVKFANGPANEFDAISDQYVAQAKPATIEVAVQSGRIPYFQFDGAPGPGVLQALNRYAARYGVQPVIDLTPLGGS